MLNEGCKIKSGFFDENGVFIYSTPNHIKYLMVPEKKEKNKVIGETSSSGGVLATV